MQLTPKARKSPGVTASKTKSDGAGHTAQSRSSPAYRSPFHPITRSTTRISTAAVAISPGVKDGKSPKNRPSARRNGSLGTFCTGLNIPTHIRTFSKISPSALCFEIQQKWETLPTTSRTAKRSRHAFSSATEDSTKRSSFRANSSDPSDAKRCATSTNQEGQFNRKSTSTVQGCHLSAPIVPLSSTKSQIRSGKSSSNLRMRVTSASAVESARSAAEPMFETNNGKSSSNLRIRMTSTSTSQEGRSTAAAAHFPTPKLQVDTVNDLSNALVANAHDGSMVKKQEEELLLEHNLENMPWQYHDDRNKTTAWLPAGDHLPLELLGARCQLCSLDLTVRPHARVGYNAFDPPVVAVLPCLHTFHNSCIEENCGFAEPSQCISCLYPEITR